MTLPFVVDWRPLVPPEQVPLTITMGHAEKQSCHQVEWTPHVISVSKNACRERVRPGQTIMIALCRQTEHQLIRRRAEDEGLVQEYAFSV